MKKYFFLSVLAIAMGVAMTSCTHSDDPSYDDVTPPTVNLASPCVSGIITDKAGNPIQGATITMGDYAATTDADGLFVISDVNTGTYTITASAEGKLSVSGTVVAEAPAKNTKNVMFNAALPSADNVIVIAATATEGGEGDLTTETLTGNDIAAIPMHVEVPADALSEDAEIIITPLYDEGEGDDVSDVYSASRATRAVTPRMLIGVSVSAKPSNVGAKGNDVNFKKPITLTMTFDEEVSTNTVLKKLVDGEWVEIPCSTQGANVQFTVSQFGSFGMFLPTNLSEKVTNEPLYFNQDVWDNLYGKAPMQVDEAQFTYNVGLKLNTKGTSVLPGLLIEKMAAIYGTAFETVDATYPINVTLPIGTRLDIKGSQVVTSITISALGRSTTATYYGDVYVAVRTSNRQHTGSGN